MATGNANLGCRWEEAVRRAPDAPILIFPAGRTLTGRTTFAQLTCRELDALSNRYAHGLARCGFGRGERVLLLLPLGVDQIAVILALFKLGAVPVFIDPGMGLRLFFQLVVEAESTALIGAPFAHVLRAIQPGAFRSVRRAVTSGPAWDARTVTLQAVRAGGDAAFPLASIASTDTTAVIFTTGSTGIPKGALYQASTLHAQLDVLQRELHVQPGQVHLVGIPIFALFSLVLGVTTILPDTNILRPAQADPARFVEALQMFQATLSLGSPALWQRVCAYCQCHHLALPSLAHVSVAGAPVSPRLVRALGALLPNGHVYTPYGTTEVLPIAVIRDDEILGETAWLGAQGQGVCVGRPVRGLDVRIIQTVAAPIAQWSQALQLPLGQAGEVVVHGDSATRQYLPRQATIDNDNKIAAGDQVWHRTGDLGYFDTCGRLWLCGRVSECVETEQGRLAPLMCEGVFNAHPDVVRSALVGVGAPGRARPIMVIETARCRRSPERRQLADSLRAWAAQFALTRGIRDFLFYPGPLPVDRRHHAKIRRDRLAAWATRQKLV